MASKDEWLNQQGHAPSPELPEWNEAQWLRLLRRTARRTIRVLADADNHLRRAIYSQGDFHVFIALERAIGKWTEAFSFLSVALELCPQAPGYWQHFLDYARRDFWDENLRLHCQMVNRAVRNKVKRETTFRGITEIFCLEEKRQRELCGRLLRCRNIWTITDQEYSLPDEIPMLIPNQVAYTLTDEKGEMYWEGNGQQLECHQWPLLINNHLLRLYEELFPAIQERVPLAAHFHELQERCDMNVLIVQNLLKQELKHEPAAASATGSK